MIFMTIWESILNKWVSFGKQACEHSRSVIVDGCVQLWRRLREVADLCCNSFVLCVATCRVLGGYDEYSHVTGQPSSSILSGKRPAPDSTR